MRSGLRDRARWRVPVAALVLVVAVVATAAAAITPTGDAGDAAAAIDETGGALTGSEFVRLPPEGSPVATFDSELAVFPLAGGSATILSTGDATAATAGDDSGDFGVDNGGGGGGRGPSVNDLVTLRLDLEVPQDQNCLSFEFRFLTEEFPEFIGSDFNDTFVAELDANDFTVSERGEVEAPANIAFGPDGSPVTVNSIGTSADNALGTTYDGASPILRASTPVEPGPHALFLSIYDAGDAQFDSAVLVDNLRLRKAREADCTRGSAPNDDADDTCLNRAPTVFASDGVATGTRGDDVIQGSDAADEIDGKGGDDLICGGPGDDDIEGGAGNDRIQGNSGADRIDGEKGRDRIDGNRGADRIKGGGGNDRLKGSARNDVIDGGGGDDSCDGGRGKDKIRRC